MRVRVGSPALATTREVILLKLYEALILKGMTERAIRLRAATIREAHAIATACCEAGEVVRGVFEIDESTGLAV